MIYHRKHFFTGAFLFATFLISSVCALGGCTNEIEPEGSKPAGRRIPLTVRATASAFVPTEQDGAPTTRIPTEDGFATEFEDGDAIGIFALAEFETPYVATVDDVYNLKLVYTKAADGTVSWTPEDDTKALYSYDDDLTYIAYYPYRDGVTIKQDNKTEIFKKLANDLPPAADQSTPEAYTGSDLMAAFAKPTADPTDANKKVLTLSFEHLHALLVLKPSEGYLHYVSPGGFEYRDEAGKYLGSFPLEATINNVNARPMDDGSFRVIIPVPVSACTPSGTYRLTDGKSFRFAGPQLATGTLTAGKCYTMKTNSQLGTLVRGVQAGDYFYRDGKLLNRDASVIPDPTNCVGIVVMGGSGSDANYGGNCVDNTVHGHAISVYDVAACKWGPDGNIGTNTSDSWNDWRGYQITQRMKEEGDANHGGFSPSNYAAAYYCLNYGNTDRGRLTTNKTSGWYLPSEGYMYQWAILSWEAINGSLTRLVSAGYGQNIAGNSYYWDASTGNSDTTARIVRLNPGKMGYMSARGVSRKVRALLTF